MRTEKGNLVAGAGGWFKMEMGVRRGPHKHSALSHEPREAAAVHWKEAGPRVQTLGFLYLGAAVGPWTAVFIP